MAESAVPSQDQLEASAQSTGAYQACAVDVGVLDDVDFSMKTGTSTSKKGASENKIVQDGKYIIVGLYLRSNTHFFCNQYLEWIDSCQCMPTKI